MVATIDPTTGLPLITSDTIGQIPLDSQVFPYDDLNAVDRPPRGPMYPDDILPTSAIVTGMDTTNPKRVQTVTTDGEHALRVYVVNESGGGGGNGVFAANALPFYKDDGFFLGSGFSTAFTADSIDNLYQVSYAVSVRLGSDVFVIAQWIVVIDYVVGGHGVEFALDMGHHQQDDPASFTAHGSIMFPGGLGNMQPGGRMEIIIYHEVETYFNCGFVGTNVVNPH